MISNMTDVPLLSLGTALSARVLSLKEAWNAIGPRRLKTARANKHADIWVTVLFLVLESAYQESHAKDQEEIRKDRPDQGGLHNSDFILHQRNDEDNQFHRISKADIEQGT